MDPMVCPTTTTMPTTTTTTTTTTTNNNNPCNSCAKCNNIGQTLYTRKPLLH